MNEAFFQHAKKIIDEMTLEDLQAGLEKAGFVVKPKRVYTKQMRFYSPEEIAKFKSMIGVRVYKNSNKPFKSGEKINTVKGADVIHPVTNRLCFTFEEDETYVECHRCLAVPEIVTN